jgi:hypothetical protein
MVFRATARTHRSPILSDMEENGGDVHGRMRTTLEPGTQAFLGAGNTQHKCVTGDESK